MQTRYFQKYTMPRGEKNRGKLKHNLTGSVFGRLKVIAFYGRIETGVLERWRKEKRPGFPEPMRVGQPYWRCVCECGNSSIVGTWNLMRKKPPHARSCGCLRKELMRHRQIAALQVLKLLEAGQPTP